MEYLLKAQDSHLQNLIKGDHKKQVERLAFHSKSFNYEIQNLCDDAKAQNALLWRRSMK